MSRNIPIIKLKNNWERRPENIIEPADNNKKPHLSPPNNHLLKELLLIKNLRITKVRKEEIEKASNLPKKPKINPSMKVLFHNQLKNPTNYTKIKTSKSQHSQQLSYSHSYCSHHSTDSLTIDSICKFL